MFKLDLGKTKEPEIKLPTSIRSSKKQENSRKTSTSALLTMPKPLTVWTITNCGEFCKGWEYQIIWHASLETHMQVKKQLLELDMLSRLVITFLPRRKHLLISWLQSLSAVIFEPKKMKYTTVSICLDILWGKVKKWKLITKSCLILCDPVDYSPPRSSLCGILQARVLEWVAIFFSRWSYWPRDWTRVSCIADRFFTIWATREAHIVKH